MDPFGDVLGIRAREAQPHMAGIIPTRVEGTAHNIRDLGTDRLGEHRRGVDALRYLHPYEQPALRVSPTAPGREILFKSGNHCILLLGILTPDDVKVVIKPPTANELVSNVL